MLPIKVVIADDHILFREGLKMVCSLDRDLTVLSEVSRGDQVVGTVQETKPDVLLLDFKMPRKNISRTLQEIAEKNPSTKVLVLSVFLEDRQVISAAQSGARGFVLKGADSATLLQAIKAVHAGAVWVDRDVPLADEFEKLARFVSRPT